MTIETKYNIGDKVYFINSRKIDHSTITKMTILVERDNSVSNGAVRHSVKYGVYQRGEMYECDLFPDKESLKDSL